MNWYLIKEPEIVEFDPSNEKPRDWSDYTIKITEEELEGKSYREITDLYSELVFKKECV